MKAVTLEDVHKKVKVGKAEKPELGRRQVLVQVKAASLNRRDLWIQKGLYPKIVTPVILGSDGAGVVVENNSGLGLSSENVVINPSMDWGIDSRVQSEEFKILGMPDNGAWAEYVTVPYDHVHPIPAHLSFLEAAALPLAGLTAYRAVFSRGEIQKGQDVLITGIGGGVALFALQFAVAAGANVYVTSSSKEKIKKAKELGAKGGALYTDENWVRELMSQTGTFNCIIDGACGPNFDDLLTLTYYGGTIVVYGGTAGNIPKISPNKLFWKQVNVKGSTMGTDTEFQMMLAFVNEHKIRPVIDMTFPLEDAQKALDRLEDPECFGKALLNVNA